MKHFLFILILCQGFFPLYAQEKWKLTKEENGIKIYTGHSDSSSFKSIKVHTVLEGTPEKLISILRSVERNKDWVYSTRKATLVKKTSPDDFIYYAETTLPWPMTNRDQAIRMTINHNPATQLLTVVTAGMPDFTPKTALVRIPYFYARWEVTVPDPNHIEINYFMQVNPGGSLPPWIVNLFVTKGPYETFYTLGEMLKKEKV